MALGQIFDAFGKSLAQLPDPALASILIKSIALTIGILAALAFGVSYGFGSLFEESITFPFLGEVTFLRQWMSWGSFLLLISLSIFLMIPVAVFISSFFLENVAHAVELKHYPHLPPAIESTFADSLKASINFLGLVLAVNLFALILYLLFFALSPVIFWAVNGYLLGREYFQMAAARRIGRKAAKSLRRKYAGRIWLAGIFMAAPLSVPLVNLLIPILGAATFTHLFHHLWKGSSD
ncbi:MAG: EI24 domain-containing protein [Paracoccaceae bacterium]|nr:EI24 domain-containing protein [Paracoccaceae bacterium]